MTSGNEEPDSKALNRLNPDTGSVEIPDSRLALEHAEHRFGWQSGIGDGLPVDPDLDPLDPGEPSREHHRALAHTPRAHLGILGAIACGGFIGTLARYEVIRAWPTPQGHIPWSLLAINTSGALMIGLVLTALLERTAPTKYLRPFITTGVIGGWTTMSTLALGADSLLKSGEFAAGITYLLITLIGGAAAVFIGIQAGRLGIAERVPEIH